MGDRCSISITCRRCDAPAFEKLGFTLEHSEDAEGNAIPDDGVSPLVIVEDQEAYYSPERYPEGIPYIGTHGKGWEYGRGEFCQHEGRKGWPFYIEITEFGSYFVTVDDDGQACDSECVDVRRHALARIEALRQLDEYARTYVPPPPVHPFVGEGI